MRMLLLLICLSALFTACAQTKTGIQTTYAYFRVSTPGNIPVDEQGNPLKRDDTVRVIYIESSGTAKPEIQSVQYPGKLYTASVFAEEKFPITVKKKDDQSLAIQPSVKTNKIWRVELTPAGPGKGPRTNKIVLKGVRGGKAFSQVIASEAELASPIYM